MDRRCYSQMTQVGDKRTDQVKREARALLETTMLAPKKIKLNENKPQLLIYTLGRQIEFKTSARTKHVNRQRQVLSIVKVILPLCTCAQRVG